MAEDRLGIAVIPIRATMDKLDADLSAARKKVEAASEKTASAVSIIGKAAKVAAIGGLAVFAAAVTTAAVALPKLISLGSNAEEMMGKFNIVFGEFAQGTISDLNNMATEMGRSKYEMREFAASFQDTFVPLGFARGTAAELSEQLVELTYDVASFNNTLEPATARDFQSALVGNHETVRKYGIVITQVGLDQELLNMGIEGGVEAATEQQKVLARLNMIMAGTADAQGDAVRTAGSWANQMRALKAAVTDLATDLGTKLLPVFTPLLSQIREFVQVSGPDMLQAVEGLFLQPIAAAVKAAGELFVFLSEGVIKLQELHAGIGAYAEAVAAGPGPEQERMTFQLEVLREMVRAHADLGDAYRELSEDAQEAIRQNTMMYDAMVPLSAIEQELIMSGAELAYQTSAQTEERDRLLDVLTKSEKAAFDMKLAEFDLNKAIEEGNRIRDVAAQRWQGLGEAMGGAAQIAQEALVTFATPIGMHIPTTPEERASEEVDAFIRAGKKIADQREQNEADAKQASADYWADYEALGKESWSKIQGFISGAFKQTEDWIRVALQGTSADLGDAWDEMARRAEAIINDVAETGTSPWLAMFDIPQDILNAGGDQLKAFMTNLAADIRESPTVQELGDVGIDAMVKNIKKSLTDELGMADLEQTVALKLASDPEAVAMMNQLGIDIDAAMGGSKDAIVSSIENMRDTTLSTTTTNFPDLLEKDTESSLLSEIVSAIKGLYDRTLDVNIENWDEFTGSLLQTFPRYAGGGRVPGSIGAPQLAVVHGEELILTPEQQQEMVQYNFYQTVNTRAEQSTVIQDFNIMQSMLGVA